MILLNETGPAQAILHFIFSVCISKDEGTLIYVPKMAEYGYVVVWYCTKSHLETIESGKPTTFWTGRTSADIFGNWPDADDTPSHAPSFEYGNVASDSTPVFIAKKLVSGFWLDEEEEDRDEDELSNATVELEEEDEFDNTDDDEVREEIELEDKEDKDDTDEDDEDDTSSQFGISSTTPFFMQAMQPEVK